MRTPFSIGFAVLLILSLVACTQESQQVEDVKLVPGDNAHQTYNDIVGTIDNNLSEYELRSGSTKSGDMNSDYRAYFDGEDLVFIHEHVNMGESGYAVNRYYFHEKTLLYCDQDKLSKGTSEDGTTITRAIVTWMVFDPDGTVIQAEKHVDGKSRAPEADEASEVIKHVDQLKLLVNK
jgi:hypothetical protein